MVKEKIKYYLLNSATSDVIKTFNDLQSAKKYGIERAIKILKKYNFNMDAMPEDKYYGIDHVAIITNKKTEELRSSYIFDSEVLAYGYYYDFNKHIWRVPKDWTEWNYGR